MIRSALFTIVLLAVLSLPELAAQGSANEDAPQTNERRAKISWADGIRLRSDDGRLRARLRGRLEPESAYFFGDDDADGPLGSLKDDFQFRRARLGISGEVGSGFHFKAEADYARSKLRLKSIYVGLGNLPGNVMVRAGNVKEPFSLEWMTSSRYLSFMERSLTSALRPSRNTGVLAYGAGSDGRFTAAVGLFHSLDDLEDLGIGRTRTRATTLRVTGVAWDALAAKSLLHVGLSYSDREYLDGHVTLDAEPEIDLAPDFADTGKLDADGSRLVGLEAAFVVQSFSLQAERIWANVDLASGERSSHSSFYYQFSWFLTGEQRPYDRGQGRFKRLYPSYKVLGPNDSPRGRGAWELAARYSELDLDDGSVTGGTLRNATLGVNWYLNARLRLMANLVRAERVGTGTVDIVGIRVQFDF